MSAWAYRCHSPDEDEAEWFVSRLDVQGLVPDVRIVRVRVGQDWKCALLDRRETLVVESQLLRDVIASDEADCPQCAELLAAATPALRTDATESPPTAGEGSADDSSAPVVASPSTGNRAGGVTVQAAAVSLQGHQFVVVVVPMTLVASPGEADMAMDDLQPYFGGVHVVLMGQKEDGSPCYYGDGQLLDMLAGIPIEKMPWREYPVG
jgi:hypothetical protein